MTAPPVTQGSSRTVAPAQRGAGAMPPSGRVLEVRRFPVKSLLGEVVGDAAVDSRGLEGDRLWALRGPDGKLASGKSTRRFRKVAGLLGLRARYADDLPVVTLPDGSECAAGAAGTDEAISRVLGEPLSLVREDDVPHHDEGPVSLVTTAALEALGAAIGRPVDPRRFRANLVVDTGDARGFVEDGWVGHDLSVGAVLLRPRQRLVRCVMIENVQSELGREVLLKPLAAVHELCFGVLADVVRPGRVRRGDPVEPTPPCMKAPTPVNLP